MYFFKPRGKYESLQNGIVKKYNQSRANFSKKYICNAPFAALRFDLYGRALVCCYNTAHVLGNYGNQTIQEIWNGNEANTLRNHIAKNDLLLGCHICKEQLLSESFSSVKSRLYDHLKPKNKYPVLLEFELDINCNLECIMCNAEVSSAIRNKQKGMPAFEKKYKNDFIEQLKPFLYNIQQANFIGGEPFLIPVYYEIIEEIIKVNPDAVINISTNGTILNDRIKNLLEKGHFDISVSIDSIKKETYELIRKNAGFDETFTNLLYFQDYCERKKTHFSIWVCPLTINRFEIPDIFDYFNRQNVPVYINNVVNPVNLTLSSLPEDELLMLKNYYQTFVFENNTPVSSENYSRFKDLINQISEWILLSIENKKLLSENSVEQIKTIILNKLSLHYKNKFSDTPESDQSFCKEAGNKFNRIIDLIEDEAILKDILIYVMKIDSSEFAQFLETKSEEFLIETLKNNFQKNSF